ncbi:protein angel homolog 2 isoform X2 [Diprion similis]|uniref:protein angel homolog 2 isoform X2 n=1 Tax=Diprion similis TaxID=362088 RepID=UPI001EF79AD9|nr:protein angel homolog 2 isoform X2 [Diprion similis]
MIPVTPLLTAITVTRTFRRNIDVILFHCKKVYHMTTIPLKHLLIKNLNKEASGVEALFSTYVDLIESNASESTHREFQKSIMEPYLKTCYGSSINHRPCDASTVNFKDNLMNHECTSSPPTNPDLNLNLQENTTPTSDIRRALQNYKAMRSWKKVGRGRSLPSSEANFVIRLFSYNILAQYLLETHSYLYKHHNQCSLEWETRKKLLIQEILEAQATVICLQEMQEDHLNEFLKPFKEHKYNHLYKKRTNDKNDGLLLMFRSDVFDLIEYENVEFFQSGTDLLNRDNVAIIVKLSLKNSPETQIVIATTHLLYNPKRNDIRLGQTQILMAELERIAFIKNTSGPKYHPIILAGDFNLQPKSGVYKFITEGSFAYMGKSRTLEQADHRRLSNSLIPPHLYVTDSCQHFFILSKRLRNRGEGNVMLENSEKGPPRGSRDSSDQNQFKRNEVDVQNRNFQKIQISDGHHVKFGSGSLTHPFKLRSVYSHIDRNGQDEATTHQDGWVTVDYIFFSEVELIEQYTLPTQKQCKALATIPNHAIGSDHLSIGATFILRKKLRQ